MEERIVIQDKVFKKFITKFEIDASVKKLASRINRDYEGKSPTILAVMKGAMLFTADLMRHINLPCELEVISAKSYGTGMATSGDVKIADFGAKFSGKDIIIVEDIVDTGLTLKALFHNIMLHNPASLEAAAILSKPDSREVEVSLKYTGIEIPPYFVVGYGLDYAEKGRNLSDIYILDNEILQS
ncbi:MAG: hypoxanthine phosphoribosyltransferase [Candidatus Kapabacteria bacterium]|nr:hypoxanthine phosphoribosyltransferase [Ignavibacteriota bacterium]MCW5886162.1 hypoxanthine phosphoribosyltransferase [Candidatus Kapabacteria bacterium]